MDGAPLPGDPLPLEEDPASNILGSLGIVDNQVSDHQLFTA
jgi:hypothetical protein